MQSTLILPSLAAILDLLRHAGHAFVGMSKLSYTFNRNLPPEMNLIEISWNESDV